MKGLLLKDYYLIRDGMVILLLTFVAVGAGLAFLTSPWVLIVVAGATISFQGAMTVQSDRSSQWDRFSATLPLPRSTVVSEKYVLYLLLCALGMALGFAVGAVAAALGRTPGPEEVCLYASTAVIVCLLTGSVNLPCTFVLTGPTMDFLAPVKMLTASTLAFADPCFPGLEVVIFTILQGSSSMLTYLPSFSSLISFISHIGTTFLLDVYPTHGRKFTPPREALMRRSNSVADLMLSGTPSATWI